MNILFISHRLYPCIVGGAEVYNYYLLKELSKSCNMTVITSCSQCDDLNVEFIKIDPRKFGSARIAIPLQDIFHIFKLRKKIDLIHVSSYMRAFWLQWLPYPLMKKLFGIPYVVTIHGGGMHPWKPEFPHRALFDNASAITGVSKVIKQEYEKRAGKEVLHIPPLLPFVHSSKDISTLRVKYGFEMSDSILLFVGSLKKIKGCDTLISAFFSLGIEFIDKHNLKLVFAGDGPMRTDLEAMVVREDFAMYIRFLGNISRDEIPAIYKLSDLYVLPSHFEGTPISMLEAMFNQMPIIGSDVNGINSVIEDGTNGLLFEVNSSAALCEKIIYLNENRKAAERLGLRAAADYEKKYHFETVVRQYRELYEVYGSITQR